MSGYIHDIVSYKVCSKLNRDKGLQEVAIDPATAILIGKILIKAVLLIKSCKGSNAAREDAVRNPSLSDLSGLKKLVRKELGWFKYILFGAKIIGAIRDVGGELDNNELKTCGLYSNHLDDSEQYKGYVEL
jgi:hypothetical protein